MPSFAPIVAPLGIVLISTAIASAQTIVPTPTRSASTAPSALDTAQLEELSKKIDLQNAKIDMLSQQILKLQQQMSNNRPGVMIGEATPAAASTPSPTPAATADTGASRSSASGSSHVVARGETLTSIAKVHGVTVSDLQKFNHIDNPLKLQAGQTILIPPSPAPAPSGSASGD